MGMLPSIILLFILTPAALVSLLLICRPDIKFDFTRRGMAELIKALHELFRDLSFQSVINKFQHLGKSKNKSDLYAEVNQQNDPDKLKCRVRLTEQKQNDTKTEIFNIDIRGTVYAGQGNPNTTLKVAITDFTDGLKKTKPVHSRLPKYRLPNTLLFSYKTELGRLPNEVTTISDWMNVAQIPSNWLIFPSRGTRDLLFDITIMSRQDSGELARSKCCFDYDNIRYGYIDLDHNLILVKTLAVALGFSVSAADSKILYCQIRVIKDWLMKNTDYSRATFLDKYRLKMAFRKTYKFFRKGNRIDIRNICMETVDITSVAQRYDILEFCMLVAKTNGSVSSKELEILKNIAGWLELDHDRFRSLMDKIIPAAMYQVEDIEAIFGVTPDMTTEQTRLLLNKEYRKWNARVTHSDSQVKSQADHMIELIAQTRNHYLG